MPAESVHLQWKSTGLAHNRLYGDCISRLNYEIDSVYIINIEYKIYSKFVKILRGFP